MNGGGFEVRIDLDIDAAKLTRLLKIGDGGLEVRVAHADGIIAGPPEVPHIRRNPIEPTLLHIRIDKERYRYNVVLRFRA